MPTLEIPDPIMFRICHVLTLITPDATLSQVCKVPILQDPDFARYVRISVWPGIIATYIPILVCLDFAMSRSYKSRLCYIPSLVCPDSTTFRPLKVPIQFSPESTMFQYHYFQLLVYPNFTNSRLCYVPTLLCPDSTISRLCYGQALLYPACGMFHLLCLQFDCVPILMYLDVMISRFGMLG